MPTKPKKKVFVGFCCANPIYDKEPFVFVGLGRGDLTYTT